MVWAKSPHVGGMLGTPVMSMTKRPHHYFGAVTLSIATLHFDQSPDLIAIKLL